MQKGWGGETDHGRFSCGLERGGLEGMRRFGGVEWYTDGGERLKPLLGCGGGEGSL